MSLTKRRLVNGPDTYLHDDYAGRWTLARAAIFAASAVVSFLVGIAIAVGYLTATDDRTSEPAPTRVGVQAEPAAALIGESTDLGFGLSLGGRWGISAEPRSNHTVDLHGLTLTSDNRQPVSPELNVTLNRGDKTVGSGRCHAEAVPAGATVDLTDCNVVLSDVEHEPTSVTFQVTSFASDGLPDA